MATDPVKTYPGAELDVTWDRRLCIHVGECGRADNTLFEGGRDPWCQPDLVTFGETVTVVERCPTGALAYARKDGGPPEAPQPRNTVAVTNRGPLYLSGNLDIEGAPTDAPGLRYRAALCRCGASKKKPFCDNAHEGSGFADRGAVGTAGDPLAADGGALHVKALPNGPLLVNGNCTILSGSGRTAWKGGKAALCRCGSSKNKPFCDGAHTAAGFSDADRI